MKRYILSPNIEQSINIIFIPFYIISPTNMETNPILLDIAAISVLRFAVSYHHIRPITFVTNLVWQTGRQQEFLSCSF